jgi:transcriptional regulator with XRE-family HTH domain
MTENISPVKEIRERIGVSQRELADAFGVHHALISNLEMNLIDISDDDEEMQSKVHRVFAQLAEHTGILKEELIRKQTECNKQQAISTRKRVELQISLAVESLSSLRKITSQREYNVFLHAIQEACVNSVEDIRSELESDFFHLHFDHCKSPVKVLREKGGITQREIAQAIGVSQTLVARVELGEMPLTGVIGKNFTELVYKGLGGPEYNERQIEECGDAYSADDLDFDTLYEVMQECQDFYLRYIAEVNTMKVENAFRTFKRKEEGDDNRSPFAL